MKNGDKPVSPLVSKLGFPTSIRAHKLDDDDIIGLTKREYFAAMAMQGILCSGGQVNHQVVAAFAIRTADALLLELEKTETP